MNTRVCSRLKHDLDPPVLLGLMNVSEQAVALEHIYQVLPVEVVHGTQFALPLRTTLMVFRVSMNILVFNKYE